MPVDNGPIRVVLADDECLFRASLRQLLTLPPVVIRDVFATDVGPGFDVVGEASSGEETVRIVEASQPELLILDLNMPRLSGLDVAREVARRPGPPRILLLTGETSADQVIYAIRLGIHGVILKASPTDLLFQAMVAVLTGRCWLDQRLVGDLVEFTRPLLHTHAAAATDEVRLTPREREVLDLASAGLGNKSIARACRLSEDTVKHHMTKVLGKVGASNRTELAARAAGRGVNDLRN